MEWLKDEARPVDAETRSALAAHLETPELVLR